jgi:hypothetical protein
MQLLHLRFLSPDKKKGVVLDGKGGGQDVSACGYPQITTMHQHTQHSKVNKEEEDENHVYAPLVGFAVLVNRPLCCHEWQQEAATHVADEQGSNLWLAGGCTRVERSWCDWSVCLKKGEGVKRRRNVEKIRAVPGGRVELRMLVGGEAGERGLVV